MHFLCHFVVVVAAAVVVVVASCSAFSVAVAADVADDSSVVKCLHGKQQSPFSVSLC